MQNVTIIIPLWNPNKEVLRKIDRIIKNQNYKGKIRVIKVDKKLGLADSLNYGIKKAKTNIIISLHQDCVPVSKNWLKKLVKPLEKENVVASVSKVELPYELWNNFNLLAKIMSAKEQKIITPLLDEKGCAYKKSALLKAGLFDNKNFRTAGEDFDMWIKLRKQGKIAYPNCKVLHLHEYGFKNRIKKEFQLANGFGALVRIYNREMPKWWIGFIKAIPLLGWFFFLINFPYFKLRLSSLLWIFISLAVNLIYSCGFWIGFVKKRQTI